MKGLVALLHHKALQCPTIAYRRDQEMAQLRPVELDLLLWELCQTRDEVVCDADGMGEQLETGNDMTQSQ